MTKDSFDFTGALKEPSGAKTGGKGTGKQDNFDFSGSLGTPAPRPTVAPTPASEPPKKEGFFRRLGGAFVDAVKAVPSQIRPVEAFKFMVDPTRNILGPNQGGIDKLAQPLIDKTLNTPTGRKVARFVAENTEDLPLKYMAFVESSATDITFRDAYRSLKNTTQGGDIKQQMANALLSSAPQSAIGVVISFVPYVGKPLASTYWAMISADEQIREKGKVDSITNIGIDVVGDSLLGASIEKMLGTSASVIMKTLKNAGVEGATEVAQTFLKYGNDLKNAETPEERERIITAVKEYVRSGAIAIEFVAGAGSGAAITAAIPSAKGVQVAPQVQAPPTAPAVDDFKGALAAPEAQEEAPDTSDFAGALTGKKPTEQKPIKITKSGARRFESASSIIKKDMDEGRDFASSLYGQGLTFSEDIAAFEQYAREKGDPQLVEALDEYRASRSPVEPPQAGRTATSKETDFEKGAQAGEVASVPLEADLTAKLDSFKADLPKLTAGTVEELNNAHDEFNVLADEAVEPMKKQLKNLESGLKGLRGDKKKALEARIATLKDKIRATEGAIEQADIAFQESVVDYALQRAKDRGVDIADPSDYQTELGTILMDTGRERFWEDNMNEAIDAFTDDYRTAHEESEAKDVEPEDSMTFKEIIAAELKDANAALEKQKAKSHAFERERTKNRIASLKRRTQADFDLTQKYQPYFYAMLHNYDKVRHELERAEDDSMTGDVYYTALKQYLDSKGEDVSDEVGDVLQHYVAYLTDSRAKTVGRLFKAHITNDRFFSELRAADGGTLHRFSDKLSQADEYMPAISSFLQVEKGDYIVDRNGVPAIVDRSNAEDLKSPNNRHTMEATRIEDGEPANAIANQVRFMTAEELEKIGVSPDLAKPDNFISEDELDKERKSGQPPGEGGTMGANGSTPKVPSRKRGVPDKGLSEAPPVAPEQPGDTGGVPDEPGKQAVRREPGKRRSGVGERPGKSDLGGVEQFNNLTQEQIATAANRLTSISADGNVFVNSLSAVESQYGLQPTYEQLRSQFQAAGGNAKKGASGRGLLDEYFTPKPVVDLAWQLASKYVSEDYQGAILEPSAGTGHFITWAPDGYQSDIQGMEINDTAARIAALAFDDTGSHIEVAPLESLFRGKRGEELKPDFSNYALVIGNPPYGEHRGEYLGLGEEPGIVKYETYFIKRSLDLTREGGYVVMVVPSAILKGPIEYSGKLDIASRGELVDARRLPAGVFGNTEIGTDILVFKRAKDLTAVDKMAQRATIMSHDNYFIVHPEHVLGETATRKGRYGDQEQFVKGDISNVEAAVKELSEDTDSTLDTRLLDGKDTPINEGVEPETEKTGLPAALAKTVKPKKPAAYSHKSTKKGKILAMDTGQAPEFWQHIEPTGEVSPAYITSKKLTAANPGEFNVDTNPAGETVFVPDFNYLQGDIYAKLERLEALKDKLAPATYKKQKQYLEAVLPTPKTTGDIAISPNSEFVAGLKLGEETLRQRFTEWLQPLPHKVFENVSRYDIIDYAKGRPVSSGDKELNRKTRRERRRIGDKLFRTFLREGITDKEKTTVAKEFNRKFNGYVRPDYNQVPLTLNLHGTFKGKPLTVRPHQRQGVGFIVNKGLGLLAHDVGLGKTMEGIIAMGEIMHRGWAKRPLVVVPNAVYEKWSSPTGKIGEIQELLPDVTVNRLGNLGGKFNGDLASLDVADGTVSVVSYEALAKLGFSDETYDTLTMGLRDAMLQMGGTERDVEKQGAKVSEIIGKAKKGTSVERFFDDLGFDFVMMDEVHNFKNIFAGAKGKKGERGANEFRNVRGSSSQRGVRSYLMAQYILGRNKGRNVVGLSATPFSNSPMEIYSILSLFAKKRMEEMGVTNVNEFMSLYMDMTPKFVVKADRTVVEEDVVERFKNLGQLQALVTEYIDFRTGEEVGIPRPAKDKRTVVLHPTKLQQEYLDKAQELFLDKEKGGAIVAITEQQSITLSPFMSRYYDGAAPTPDTLADESPKIKQAVAAMKQNLKDQPKAGQVLYMPRGTQFYPVLKQYIIEQLGLKATQVAIIEGGMTPEKKQSIQDDFNGGKVKVLIGSEAIKEGVDLQETSTDVHHLHLPWNPTDMIQVEGRIWRQGNQWKNVRIHYYLIENSVDQFIFQKLETKEKRIKNIWSYKGDNIEVGDLDFENMKLDLITDPVMRVRAEREFEASALEATIAEKDAELAYIGRRIERRTELEENLTANKERLETATTDYNKEYYQTRIADITKELSVLNGEKSVGTEEEVKARMDGLTSSLETLRQQKEDMKAAFETKLANAKTESKETVLVDNDYTVYQKQLAGENGAFFTKASEQSTPSGAANTRTLGQRPEINTDAVGLVDKVRPMELPELVHLAKELMGDYPTVVKNIKNSVAVGMFRGIEGIGPRDIRLVAGLFDSKNVADAAIVLGHEVGHLTDFLPDNTMKRGNIRNRLMLVKQTMNDVFGEQVKVKEIKDELVELTRWWNPYDPETVPASYRKYRESSRELYADALSVLLNAPADLAIRAPTFYKAFFATLDEKPDVYEAYFAIQELLTDPEKVQEARHERLVEGFKRGNEAQLEATAKRKGRAYSLWLRLRMLLDDKYAPVTVKVHKAEQAGEIVPPDQDPKFLLDELPFVDNENFVLLETIQEQVREPVAAAGFTDEEIGEYLFHSRVLTGRADVANPLGFTPKTSQEQLDRLRTLHGEEAFAVLEEKVKAFHEIVFKSVEEAVRVGYYNRKTYEETILPNRYNYAAFGVVDYLTDRMPAGVKKQIGTLKEVANPFITTLMKTIALNRVNAIQRAKLTTRDFLSKSFSGEITPAKAIKGPENITLRYMPADGMGLLELFEDGKPTAYSVDPYIAESFANDSGYMLNLINSIGTMLQKPNNVFKALFTTYRPGFALAFNPIRDVKRNYKLIPGATIYNLFAVKRNVLLQFLRSLPDAAKFAKGELTPFTEMLVDMKAIHAPFGDQHYDPSEDEFTRLLQKYHIGGDMSRLGWGSRARKAILKPLIVVLDAMRFAGNTFETASKLGGTRVRMARGESGRSLAYNVRNFTGTPNWSKKGLLTKTTNNIWLFSNIMKEGMKSDYITATSPKTAGGYWWKTAKIDLFPKLLMFMAAAGLFGDWLKEFYGKMSEYDKTNYTLIPLGIQDNGKAVAIRIPHDEGGRLEAAVFWKLMNMIKDKDPHGLADIFSFGAGQLPSLTPTLAIPLVWKDYFSGKNPVDSFRGRNIIDDVTFTAGGWAPTKKMLEWTGNQVGVFNFATFDPSRQTGIETAVQVAPWFSSLFKISDYGEVEQYRGVKNETKADEAKATLERRELVDDALEAIRADGPDSVNKHAREAAKALLGHWPRNPDENTRFNTMVKRVKEEYLGQSEGPAMDVLAEAATKEQQKKVLREIRTRMNDEEWKAFRRKAINGRIVQPDVFFGIK